MNKVYYTKTKTNNFNEISIIAKTMLGKFIQDSSIKLNYTIPIKVHFGERGNTTFIPAIAYEGIIDLLKEKNIDTAFIETNVLYRGSRTSKDSHIEIAKEHGFTQIPIIIADGNIGENFYEQQINKKYFRKCKIGAEYEKYNQIIVCSHFKGHIAAGFGGALKQLGMGFAARGGKLDQHSLYLPIVNQTKCISCRKCIDKCGARAIVLSPKAFIDKNLCLGCAGCIATCTSGAINHDWEGHNFMEKMVEYAYAASLNKQNIYINFASNITKDCDCMGHQMQAIAENVGIFLSTDPVAIDAASLDLLQEQSGTRLFDEGRKTLEYATEIGIGNMDYELIIEN